MHQSNLLDLNIHSDPQGVRRGLDRINTALAARGCDADLRGSAEILLAEVMNNIVEHAYAGRARGTILVEVNALETALQFRICDDGVPLPDHAVRPKQHDLINTPVGDLPEGGFGWGLIYQIASKLDYQRADGLNILTFEIPYSEDDVRLGFEEKVRMQHQAGS